MEYIKIKSTENVLTVFLTGRIDSSNIAAVEAEVTGAVSQNKRPSVILDAKDLLYISSAGLRMVLRLVKSNDSVEVINASGDVYDVFEMTGFTEILPVRKAFRTISVEGCKVIGQGAKGKVFRIDDETIVKYYMEEDSLADIKHETELARKAFVLGIPTAIPYDIVRVLDGYGSVFELLDAKSLSTVIREDPENIDKHIKDYVDLMKLIHGTKVSPDDMPDFKLLPYSWLKVIGPHLPADKAEKLERLFRETPDTGTMLHGDYHINNVKVQNGELLLIDMDTLSHGHPVFELAGLFNCYKGFGELDPNVTQEFLSLPKSTADYIWEKAIPMYLDSDDEEFIQSVRDRAALVGYTRLFRRTIKKADKYSPEELELHYNTYRNHIIELLDKVDKLGF